MKRVGIFLLLIFMISGCMTTRPFTKQEQDNLEREWRREQERKNEPHIPNPRDFNK